MGRKTLKLRWTRSALADLIEAQQHIAQDHPAAAQAPAQRVWETANNLTDYPEIGRRGHVDGTREWLANQTPYLIVYRVRGKSVEILRVWHGRRNRHTNPTGR
ncbi:MAG: type II toxin-antitoxin system RelE/ParE family toxin [Chloroflexota bacterium]